MGKYFLWAEAAQSATFETCVCITDSLCGHLPLIVLLNARLKCLLQSFQLRPSDCGDLTFSSPQCPVISSLEFGGASMQVTSACSTSNMKIQDMKWIKTLPSGIDLSRFCTIPVGNCRKDISRHPKDKSRHPKDKSRHPKDRSRHPQDNSKQPKDNSKHPKDESKHSSDKSKQPSDKSKQPPDKSKHPSDKSKPSSDNYRHQTDNSNHQTDNSSHQTQQI